MCSEWCIGSKVAHHQHMHPDTASASVYKQHRLGRCKVHLSSVAIVHAVMMRKVVFRVGVLLALLQLQLGATQLQITTEENSCCNTLEAIQQLKEEVHKIASLTAAIYERDRIIQESLCINRTGEIKMCAGNSCRGILEEKPDRPSGYYWLKACDTCESFQAFCDFSLNLEGSRGWMRVADLDMTDPTQQCPRQFRLITSPRRVCGKSTDSSGCDATYYETHNLQYSKVAGRAAGYMQNTADGLVTGPRCPSCNINKPYVDGISITHGYPRVHIWTYAGSHNPHIDYCPCTIDASFGQSQPNFVGSDYYCEVASSMTDRLWDGEGCTGREVPCCQRVRERSGWFIKEINAPSTNDIEVRICTDEERSNEDIWVERFELYVQ